MHKQISEKMIGWETIITEMPYVYRLAVPGGWLYRVYDSRATTHVVFVADPRLDEWVRDNIDPDDIAKATP